ncbi:hypothetical protein COY05_04370 [Candidatus Peregrinibacteria bacterium CG_4_10_14_0_2_um_filter_38_24]|nr:MAG: hypothetical protein COY05_04370 [Candidatus Peregrinibacteria bacterium CG_4_10_14_0_2_um_filter_38_24]PJC39231.1 MAG: hypothetical protein CO044_00770 [Candidatus Peregrinibacteria bacterium CG_4_9_14_0_2_um_filter_38_9]
MQTFFKPASEKNPKTEKWTPVYTRTIEDGPTSNMQTDSLNKEFNTQEEADQYCIGYCLQQGYTQID